VSTDPTTPRFGSIWFEALAAPVTETAAGIGSLRQSEIVLDGGEKAVLLAIVPDANARFPRARSGEVGLEEGYALARALLDIVETDASAAIRRPVITVIDVPSQAYGYVEELLGVHQALAAATNAYATARLAGHPVISLIVGKAISGAFLATGLQANRIVALDHDGIAVQVMGKAAAARITRRTIAELDAAATAIPATAYDGRSFAKLGAVADLVAVTSPAAPTEGDLGGARGAVSRAVESVRAGHTDLGARLTSEGGQQQRAASVLVRQRVAEAWNA
jgi:biotin-independent malonate decarboxylase gamma subunit